MIRIKSFLLLFTLLLSVNCFAQKKLSNSEYAAKYSDLAQQQMKKYGIPASITLAQGILESGCGSSRLAVKANNHFGIKCGSNWSGKSIRHDDDRRKECFRKYSSVKDSYLDHSLFLVKGSRYSSLFRLDKTDYKGWAYGLSAAGYATNPKYPELLIGIIERGQLWKYDGATGKQKKSKTKGRGRIPLGFGLTNGVMYAVVVIGEDFYSLSERVNLSVKKLLKYNDLPSIVPIEAGMAIYLAPKKSKNREAGQCVVSTSGSLHTISQQYGVKLESLLDMNPQYRQRSIAIGDVIKLK
ncbi:MAG: glucosaminidase domain-containing protein [Rikenellaceae bacterium]